MWMLPLTKSCAQTMWIFGQHKHRFGWLSSSNIAKNGDTFLDVQLKCFRRCDAEDFERHQKLAIGKTDFRQLIQNRNRLAVAAAEFDKAENVTHINPLLPSRDYETQQTLTHRVRLWIDPIEKFAAVRCSRFQHCLRTSQTIYEKQTRRHIHPNSFCELQARWTCTLV